MGHTATPAAPRRVLGYCRVSTDQQGESGAGLEHQRAVIDSEVARNGWDLIDVYVDVASGKSTRRRPRLLEAMARLDAGEAECLLVSKLDRLSRSVLDFASLMAQADREGWGITAVDIGVDTSTVNGELVANVLMSMAHWERRIIGERTKDALSAVRARGTRLGRPRGVSEDTAALIRVLRAQGRGYQAIANVLNEQKVPTGQGGVKWHPSTVRAVAQRDASTAAH